MSEQTAATGLRAAPDPKPKGSRNPSYTVFRQHNDADTTPGSAAYTLLSEQVAAPSRKEAIKQATEGLEAEKQSGTFLVVQTKEIKRITRKRRTETVDDFE